MKRRTHRGFSDHTVAARVELLENRYNLSDLLGLSVSLDAAPERLELSAEQPFAIYGSVNGGGDSLLNGSVDYGDNSGLIPLQLGNDGRFTLDHNYKTAGTYELTVNIRSSTGQLGSLNLELHVGETPLASSRMTQMSFAPSADSALFSSGLTTDQPTIIAHSGDISEGSLFTSQAMIFDNQPNQVIYDVSLDYGDGSPLETFTVNTPIIPLSHLYDQDSSDQPGGVYSGLVSITGGGYSVSESFQVQVINVAPQLDLGSAVFYSFEPLSITRTFDDPGNEGTWTGTVDYGDGSGIQALTVNSLDKTFSLNHLYSDPGLYTVNITLSDDDTTISGTLYAASINSELPGPYVEVYGGELNEGSTFTTEGTIYAEPDSGPYLVTINYGDGTSPVSFLHAGDTLPLSHLYPQDSSDREFGYFEGTVSIIDSRGTRSDNYFEVFVFNVAPVFELGTDATVPAGQAISRTVSFTDPGADKPWTGTIDFGDGSGLQPLVIDSDGKTLTFSHAFAAPGTYLVTATVYDDDDFGVDSFTVTVEEAIVNQPPVIVAPNGEINEGDTFSGVARFTDDSTTSGPYSVVVSYGDGSSPINFTTTSSTIDLDRLFSQDSSNRPGGVYTGSISVTDELGATGTTTFSVLVHNIAPQFDLGPSLRINPGTEFVLNVPFTDPGADSPWTGLVDYGDGSGPQAIEVDSNGKTFGLRHVFNTPGVYIVDATIFDDDASGNDKVTIYVNAPPVVTAPSGVIYEGSTFTDTASFTDDPVTAGGVYVISIDFGDGNGPTTFTSNSTDIPLSRFFPQDSSDRSGRVFNGTVSITDELGLTGTSPFQVEVLNVAPVFDLGPTLTISPGDTINLTVPFTDPGADAPWTGTVDFGDGTGVQSIVVDSIAKTFTITHTFSTAGTFSVDARLFDDDTFGTDTLTVIVINSEVPGPQVTAEDGVIDEGSVFTATATIYPGGEPTDTYTVTIDYGDGSTPETRTVTGTQFVISHLYPQDSSDEGSGVFGGTITVTSSAGGIGVTDFSVLVHNVPPRFELGPDVTIMKGDSIARIIGFTDPGADNPWTGTIDFGDGNGPQSLTVDSIAKLFDFEKTFATPGTYTVTVTVFDDDSSGTDSFVVTVQAPPPPVNHPPVVIAPSGQINEGSTFNATAMFTDDATTSGPYTVTINYGNGSAPVTYVTTGNTIPLSKLYPQDSSDRMGGVFQGTITVTDELGARGTANFSVLVHNVPPKFELGPDVTIMQGGSVARSIGFTDPGADNPWTGTIDFGDGNGPQSLTVDSIAKLFDFEKTFVTPGTYTVTVTVFDDDSSGTDSFVVTVQAPPPPVNHPPVVIAPSGQINEGSTFNATAMFTDDATTSGPYTVTINYGNGSAPVTYVTTGNTIPLSKLYPQDSSDRMGGVFQGTITVTDELGASGTANFSVLVHNVPPQFELGPNQSLPFGGGTIERQVDFTDPGADRPWYVVVDYGDGTIETFYTDPKSFKLEHTYSGFATSYQVVVTVFDDDSFGQDSFLVTTPPGVFFPPPMVPPVIVPTPVTPPFLIPPPTFGSPFLPFVQTLPNQALDVYSSYYYGSGDVNHPPVPHIEDRIIDEGDVLIYDGYFTDPDPEDTHTGWVDYGEGRGWEPLPLRADKTFQLRNLYEQDGIYIVRVKIMDDKGAVGYDEMRVTVNNVPPDVDLDATNGKHKKCKTDACLKTGDELTAIGSFDDPGADSWTATVDYGDGTPTEQVVLNGKTFKVKHVYTKAGVYTVTVTVNDGKHDGKATITVEVADPNAVQPPVEGGPDAALIDQLFEGFGDDDSLQDGLNMNAIAISGALGAALVASRYARKLREETDEDLRAMEEALARYGIALD